MIESMAKAVFLLMSVLLLACPVLAGETVLEAGSTDGAKATLTLSGSPLLTMTPTGMHLVLNRAHSEYLRPITASCDMTMPAMPMPENRPRLSCSATGCRGEVIFTMAGAWEAACDVSFSSGKNSRFVFAIDMVQMK